MTTQTAPPPFNPFTDDDLAALLRLRMKTYWNMDYFERIVLPLLDLPQRGCVLDVGCGNGGISLLLAGLRPDLQITGMDLESKPLEDAASFAARSGVTNLRFEQGDAHQAGD